jgi:hypothetical protein
MIKAAGKILKSDYYFLYGSLLIITVFVITRIPYFVFYPVINLSSDSASYIAAALKIYGLKSVLFDIRTPGYPLFISLVWIFSKSYIFISLFQSLISLFACLFFLKTIHNFYPSVTFYAAAALSAYISSSFFIIIETSILTESLFVSGLLITCALLILALKKNKELHWMLFSSSAAIVILVRPAGLFLLSLFIFIPVYFFANKFNYKYYIYLLLPFCIIIFSLCFYNYRTLNSFTITPFGEANLSGVTLLFMETSPEYSPGINSAIQKTLDSIPSRDIKFVKNNYDVSKLYNIFRENFYRQVILADNIMKNDSLSRYIEIQPFIRKISTDAIKKYPEIYAKFFICNFLYFLQNSRVTMNYFPELEKIYKAVVIDKKYIAETESQKWLQISSDTTDNGQVKNYILESIKSSESGSGFIYNGKEIQLKETFSKSLYEVYEKAYNIVFRNVLWIILSVFVYLWSFYKSIKCGFKDADYFIVMLFGVIYLSKAILVSSVESSLIRYSYTVEFAVFMSLPFLILLLKKFKIKNI